MGSTPDFTYYDILPGAPTSGGSDPSGSGIDTPPNHLTWTGTALTTGQTTTWNINGFNVTAAYTGYTDQFNDPVILYNGTNYILTNTNTGTFNFVADAAFTACYLRGTLIATPHGERPVEDLAAGDLVRTAAGMDRPIRWIGRSTYASRFLARNPDLQPIRFRAGCLGGGLPRRDLLVSSDHAMFLDGVLIPASCLVNGVSITVAAALPQVDYFHVELDSHDVLLAEGAPSESFADDGSRFMFHNAHELPAQPAEAPTPLFCAPRMETGYEVAAVWSRLAALAGCSAAA